MLHRVGELFELNVKLRCQKVILPDSIFVLDAIKQSYPPHHEVQNILTTLTLSSGTRWRWSGLPPRHRNLGDCQSWFGRFFKRQYSLPS
jgi:hypothetical protein